jgi:mannose-6-phosphate isomerase
VNYPIRLHRSAVPKPWAGDRLRGLFPATAAELPPGTGESLEVCDLPRQSSVVANGAWRGRTLATLMETHRDVLLGELSSATRLEDFPVCIKFLDTSQPLSIQCHPHDLREQGRLVQRGKSECWLVLDAGPDAVIYQGLKPGVPRDDFEDALDSGTPADMLNARAVKAGQFLYNPQGMIHAIGADVALLEIQQNCGVTWRLWDFPREGPARETHRQDGLADARFDLPLPPLLETEGDVVLAPHGPFGVRSMHITKAFQERRAWPGFTLHTCIHGSCEITGRWADNLQPAILKAGETVLWPAGLDKLEYYPDGECRLVQSWARE